MEWAVAAVEHEGDLSNREVCDRFLKDCRRWVLRSCINGYTIEDVRLDGEGIGEVAQAGFIRKENTDVFALVKADGGCADANRGGVQASNVDFNLILICIVVITEGFLKVNKRILSGNDGVEVALYKLVVAVNMVFCEGNILGRKIFMNRLCCHGAGHSTRPFWIHHTLLQEEAFRYMKKIPVKGSGENHKKSTIGIWCSSYAYVDADARFVACASVRTFLIALTSPAV